MGNTESLVVIGIVAFIALILAIAALVESLEQATPANFFKINRSPGFYSMYGTTVVSPQPANTAASVLGGTSVGSNVIPENFLKPGGCFVVQATGAFQTAGGAQVASVFLNIAPKVIVNMTGLSAGNILWRYNAIMTCIDKANMNVSASLSFAGSQVIDLGNIGFDTTAKQTIDLNVQFAEAGDTERWSTTSLQEFFIFEQLKTLLV